MKRREKIRGEIYLRSLKEEEKEIEEGAEIKKS